MTDFDEIPTSPAPTLPQVVDKEYIKTIEEALRRQEIRIQALEEKLAFAQGHIEALQDVVRDHLSLPPI
jgi:hypothetical protein